MTQNLFWWRGEHAGVQLGFTSTAAGNLSQSSGPEGQGLANRRRLEDQLGLVAGQLRFLHQVHSADVRQADLADDSSGYPIGDAWVSAGSTSMAIMVADCLPVLFTATAADGSTPTAAAHAGRDGLLEGVLENTVAALEKAGAESVHGWIGPGACGDCYEVSQQMFDELTADRPALASTTSWGTPALNLRAEATAVLESAGVAVHNDPGGCTIEEPSLFSYRRANSTGAPQGRMAGLLWRS